MYFLPRHSWNYAPVYGMPSFHNFTFLFFFFAFIGHFFRVSLIFLVDSSVSFHHFGCFRFIRLSLFLEDISLVLRPQLYRLSCGPEFSEDTLSPSDCVSVSFWVSGSSINLEGKKASGVNISDSRDHKPQHSNPIKQSVEVTIERQAASAYEVTLWIVILFSQFFSNF